MRFSFSSKFCHFEFVQYFFRFTYPQWVSEEESPETSNGDLSEIKESPEDSVEDGNSPPGSPNLSQSKTEDVDSPKASVHGGGAARNSMPLSQCRSLKKIPPRALPTRPPPSRNQRSGSNHKAVTVTQVSIPANQLKSKIAMFEASTKSTSQLPNGPIPVLNSSTSATFAISANPNGVRQEVTNSTFNGMNGTEFSTNTMMSSFGASGTASTGSAVNLNGINGVDSKSEGSGSTSKIQRGMNPRAVNRAHTMGTAKFNKKMVAPKRKLPTKLPPKLPSRGLPQRTIIANVKRVKQKYFNPRKHGVLKAQEADLCIRLYAAIEGLPSSTRTSISFNVDEKEMDKKEDVLVPMVCFFQNKKEYDQLVADTKNVSVRDATFHLKFAEFCTKIIRLDTAEIDHQLSSLMEKLDMDSGGSGGASPKSPTSPKSEDLKADTVLYIAENVHDRMKTKINMFSCENGKDRNAWIAAMVSLVTKRRKSSERRSGGSSGSAPSAGRYKMRLY